MTPHWIAILIATHHPLCPLLRQFKITAMLQTVRLNKDWAVDWNVNFKLVRRKKTINYFWSVKSQRLVENRGFSAETNKDIAVNIWKRVLPIEVALLTYYYPHKNLNVFFIRQNNNFYLIIFSIEKSKILINSGYYLHHFILFLFFKIV